MCGIAAAIGVDDGAGLTKRALEQMIHRGPDGSGVAETGPAALGMCRLQVRRPAAARLPLVCAGVRCAYNGEVYGERRSGAPPPETVEGELALLLEHRPADIDGMWALVTLRDGSLLLSRDRWGIRPLYYRPAGSGWLVASEMNALRRILPVSTSIEALREVVVFGTPLSQDSVYPELRSVSPGSMVRLADGGREERTAWSDGGADPDAQAGAPPTGSLSDAIRDSVRRNLAGERPMGLALSGGLDSQLLGSYLLELRVPGLTLVSVVVEGVEDDAPAAARRLLEGGGADLGWSLATTTVDPTRYLDLLDRAGAVLAEPTRMSSVPLYLALADVASEAGVVVLLCGEGADELFLGYESYRGLVGSSLVADAIARHYLPPALHRWAASLAGDGAADRWAERNAEQLRASGDRPDRLRRAELHRSLRPLLERCDACLMSRSVEGRTPYLHGGVPDAAFALPAAELLSGGGKAPLREIARRRLGPAIGAARKVPFRAPIASWLSGHSPSFAAGIRGRVGRACRALELSESAGARLVRAASGGDAIAAGLVAGLLSVDAWLKA